MESSARQFDADQAQQACASCRMRKRKCDKGIPKCGSCLKKKRTCDYSKSEEEQKNGFGTWPYTSSSEDGQRSQHVDLSTILFLDPRVLSHGHVDIHGPSILVPGHILDFLGDITEVRQVASNFFKTIHVWMPFISKKRFYDHLLHPSSYSRAEIVLLFLCMKLITGLPPNGQRSPQSPVYFAAKHFYIELESYGMLSIQVLQAGILLALYEIGHAIYPAAFLSVGYCARFAHALGINSGATSQISKVTTLIEVEERRRVWWAIVILDRFVSVGCPGRPFATEDPTSYELLPAHDAAWDRGETSPNDLSTLSSPSSGHMSKFALLCQAARLLGEVLRHVSSEIVDQQQYDEEDIQLNRTINAMINASECLSSPDYDQISFGYCALMALHEPWITSKNEKIFDKSRCQRARTAMETISHRIIADLPEKIPHMARNLESISPWGLYLAYQAYVTYIRLNRENESSDTSEAMNLLKQTLCVLETRWKLAGAYLQLIEARNAMEFI